MDDTLNILLMVYLAGVAVVMLFAIMDILASFIGSRILRKNLQKIGVTYNPFSDNFYKKKPSEMTPKEIKEVIEYDAALIFFIVLVAVCSWLGILLVIVWFVYKRITKPRLTQVTREQKSAAVSLRRNPHLTEEEVWKKLKEWNEDFYYQVITDSGP
jgi:p-aminobenzoyl-glutamate transporter AbgT